MESTSMKKTIVFEGGERAPVLPVSGAWGGVAPTGNSIVASFFQAYASLPNVISMEGPDPAHLDPNTGSRVVHGDITQHMVATLVMTPEDCKSIGKWLMDKADEALRIRQERSQQGP
jgi:hypothetical protein